MRLVVEHAVRTAVGTRLVIQRVEQVAVLRGEMRAGLLRRVSSPGEIAIDQGGRHPLSRQGGDRAATDQISFVRRMPRLDGLKDRRERVGHPRVNWSDSAS